MPAGLGTLFAGLLLIVLAFVEGSSVWKALHEVLFGLFGCGSFVLGAAICYLAILYTRGEDLIGQMFKLMLGLVFASGTVIVFSEIPADIPAARMVAECYQNGVHAWLGGGAIGALLGGNLLLLGIFLKVGSGDSLIANLSKAPHDLAFWAILIGVAVNAAIPPVNAWLVDAYPEGTITGSVFLSSFTTKVAVYALIRIFAGTDFLMGFGCFMALYGAAYAIMENDMRRLLGYHIISQVGFMVAGVGVGTAMALNGAAAHAFSHILYKSLLFMCAGAIIYATGIRKINQLSGMAKKMPFVAVCFFVAAFSISGVPFFNGFISKTITIAAASAAGYDWVYTLLELASIGTFLSITLKMGYFIFLRDADKNVEIKNPLPKNMYLGMGFGAALCFLYGVYPDLLYRYLPFGYPDYQPFTAAHMLSYVEILVVTMVPFMMFLPRMEPHTALSLDTDWFYRKPIDFVIVRISMLLCAISGGLGSAWGVLYEKFMDLTSNPMDFLDAKPFRKRTHYNPENYRTSIADPMMITLTVLVSSIAYFIATL